MSELNRGTLFWTNDIFNPTIPLAQILVMMSHQDDILGIEHSYFEYSSRKRKLSCLALLSLKCYVYGEEVVVSKASKILAGATILR